MKFKKVVVTGIGAITPIGKNLEEYKDGLFSGKSGAGPVTLIDVSQFACKFACEVKDFDPTAYNINRKDARKMDRFTQLGVVAAEEAIAHANLDDEAVDKTRVGVILGSGVGGLGSLEKEIMRFATEREGKDFFRFNPFFIPRMIIDIAAGHLSIRHGYRGPNLGVVSACASATNAMIDACMYIQMGKADAIVTGGADACVTYSGMGGFSGMKALSTRNDDPLTASRPFDKDRDGFVMGEGAGALVLESEEHALARGAKIYAEVAGYGMSADAFHLTAPHPEGLGATDVMNNALKDGDLKPEDIDYINVHGTSTPLGDIAESKAILSVFGKHAYKLNISSTKSMTGHLLGAAGAVESIACILAILNQKVPPTINHFTDDPDIDPNLNLTFNKAEERSVRYALSNTFGFGGHNASVIWKNYEI